MRYFLCICLCVVAWPVFAYNEVVPAISYNPSRLGSYTHLKAVETARLQGGMKAVGEESTFEHDKPVINIFKEVTLQDNGHNANSPSDINNENTNKITVIGEGSKVKTNQSGGILQGKSGSLYAANGYIGGNNHNNSGLSVIVKPGGTLKATHANDYSYIGAFNDSPELNINLTGLRTLQLTENKIVVSTDLNSYTIGGVLINNPKWPGGVSGYSFKELVDKNGTRYKVLSATKK